MKEALIVLPHQLFEKHPGLQKGRAVFIIEDPIFFTAFTFHKKKLILHRASMKYYQYLLEKKGYDVTYVAYDKTVNLKTYTCFMLDPVDSALEKKYNATIIETPCFLNTRDEIKTFFTGKKGYAMRPFYIDQRKKRKILVRGGKPVGGKWSFDTENRLKIPAGTIIPKMPNIRKNKYVTEATMYVEEHFKNNYGIVDNFIYPITHTGAHRWLDDFLQHRLKDFGPYEDAIKKDESFLFHSVLSPLLNIGLLTPQEVIDKTLAYAKIHKIPLNSLEGFIRQVVGWREFIRAMYLLVGEKQKKSNFWKHRKKLSHSFYAGTTGIEPVDTVTKKVMKYAYCHHIERLMVLGNFMLLTRVHPNQIYKWFMELFVDAYEWVMIPNVYGMSQYADGGMITTKPYISGSSYIKKMSDFKTGSWCEVWDALYWNFIYTHKTFFKKSARMAMMASILNKMDRKKLKHHLVVAKKYL